MRDFINYLLVKILVNTNVPVFFLQYFISQPFRYSIVLFVPSVLSLYLLYTSPSLCDLTSTFITNLKRTTGFGVYDIVLSGVLKSAIKSIVGKREVIGSRHICFGTWKNSELFPLYNRLRVLEKFLGLSP